MAQLSVKSIFEAQGYKYDKDGRNRTHRSLQSLLDTGFVTFNVCERGMVWTNKNGFKYNVVVRIKRPNGNFFTNYWYLKTSSIDGYDVLKMIGETLQNPEVKTFISSYVDIDSSCQKCNGYGIIPAFHYYCNGVCFDCYGLGFNRKHFHTVKITA